MTLLGDIFTYALRGSGKYILIIGAVLTLGCNIVSLAPLVGVIAYMILLGYFCALYFDVILTTATGGEEAPSFPNPSNILEDILWPMLQVFIVLFLSFLPMFAYGWVMPQGGASGEVSLILFGLGVCYFPMAMLAVAVLGSLGAMSPHIVLPSIFRAGWLYWLAVFLLVLLYMAERFIGGLLSGLPFLITIVLAAVMGMYTLLTNGRVLGVIYRERSEELRWL